MAAMRTTGFGRRQDGRDRAVRAGIKSVEGVADERRRILGSNWASDPKVTEQDAPQFEPEHLATSPNARHVRWEQLIKKNKGKIDVELAEKMLEADHIDAYTKRQERMCGRFAGSGDYGGGRRDGRWRHTIRWARCRESRRTARWPKEMKLVARAGHPCGANFLAKPFLAAHPEYALASACAARHDCRAVDGVSLERERYAVGDIFFIFCAKWVD